MRCNQFIGLKTEADTYLDENCVRDHIEIYVNGIRKSEHWSVRQIEGKYKINYAFGQEDEMLPAYERHDGSKIYEKVQCTPWSSGPMFFIYLVDEDGNPIPESVWTDDEINDVP